MLKGENEVLKKGVKNLEEENRDLNEKLSKLEKKEDKGEKKEKKEVRMQRK